MEFVNESTTRKRVGGMVYNFIILHFVGWTTTVDREAVIFTPVGKAPCRPAAPPLPPLCLFAAFPPLFILVSVV